MHLGGLVAILVPSSCGVRDARGVLVGNDTNFFTYMDSLLKLLSDPLINLAVAAIVGIATNLVAARLTEKSRRLWWDSKSSALNIDYYNKTGKLRVAYKVGNSYREVGHGLATTRLVFWSSGEEAILEEDVAQRDPLRIEFPENVLELRAVAWNNPTISLETVDNTVLISFEYLHKNQGLVCDILYAGNKVRPKLLGTIKGGKVLNKKIDPPTMPPSHPVTLLLLLIPPRRRILTVRIFSSVAFVFLFWLLLTLAPEIFPRLTALEGRTLLALGYIILPLFGYGTLTYQMWNKAIIPHALGGFYENFEEEIWWARA